jgi:hypothetical protein
MQQDQFQAGRTIPRSRSVPPVASSYMVSELHTRAMLVDGAKITIA